MTVQPQSKTFFPTVSRGANNVFAPIQREFDRLFDQLATGWSAFTDIDVAPRMDMRDTKDGIELSFELPGIDKDDVKIALQDNVVTISGEKKSEKDSEQAGYRVSERAYGAFSRSIALPHGVDASRIRAAMKDGVLTLTAPKVDGAESKTIQIQSGT